MRLRKFTNGFTSEASRWKVNFVEESARPMLVHLSAQWWHSIKSISFIESSTLPTSENPSKKIEVSGKKRQTEMEKLIIEDS